MNRAGNSWDIVGIGQIGASLVDGIFQSNAPVTLRLPPRSVSGVRALAGGALIPQATRAAANQCLPGRGDMGEMAAEIARPGTFTAVGPDLLRERGMSQAWSDACQRVFDACRQRER